MRHYVKGVDQLAHFVPYSPNPFEDLAWTAPELLCKIGSNDDPIWRNWSRAADVYSFGIIMQEILLKGAPFCNNKPLTLSGSLTAWLCTLYSMMHAQSILTCPLCRVADCVFRVLDSPPEYPFRPCIQNNVEASKGYCQLMEAAWSEREEDRPPFSDILLQLQQTFPQLKYACRAVSAVYSTYVRTYPQCSVHVAFTHVQRVSLYT